MPGGDKPGCSGSETPDQTTESSIDIKSEQKEKFDIMSDPESSISNPRSNDSEYGSRLQTPDLTTDCSSSLPSEYKEKSSTEVPLEDKEISGALTDSEISKSDPSAESDTGSGLQSPDLKDCKKTQTLEHLETEQVKKDVLPMNKSCRVPSSDVVPKCLPPEDENGEGQHDVKPLNVIDSQPEISEVSPDRHNINELSPNIGRPTGHRRVWNAICRYVTDTFEQTKEKDILVNKSCVEVTSEVESPFSPEQGEIFEENMEPEEIAPQVENEEEVYTDRYSTTEPSPNATSPTGGRNRRTARNRRRRNRLPPELGYIFMVIFFIVCFLHLLDAVKDLIIHIKDTLLNKIRSNDKSPPENPDYSREFN